MPEPIKFESLSPRFQLPFLFAGQAQKEFFINEALARLDFLLHPSVEGESADPPSSPIEGQCWLIAANATGAWMGRDGSIAAFIAGDWAFADPFDGLRVWDKAGKQSLAYSDGWQRAGAPVSPSGGSTVDTQARAAIEKVNETLRNAGIFSSN